MYVVFVSISMKYAWKTKTFKIVIKKKKKQNCYTYGEMLPSFCTSAWPKVQRSLVYCTPVTQKRKKGRNLRKISLRREGALNWKRISFRHRNFKPHVNLLFQTQDITVWKKISLVKKDRNAMYYRDKILQESFHCPLKLRQHWSYHQIRCQCKIKLGILLIHAEIFRKLRYILHNFVKFLSWQSYKKCNWRLSSVDPVTSDFA